MFKKLVLAASTLLMANLSSGLPASAATHHLLRHHRASFAMVAHGHRSARLGAPAGRPFRHLFAARRAAALYRVAAFRRHRAHGLRLAERRAVRGRVAETRYGALRRDAMIRNYVGPRSAYRTVSAPAGGLGVQVGGASYYGGGRTANGGVVGAATCAHRTLPFGTKVLVTNLANGAKTILTVNDRGPFVRGRILDVSRTAANTLGMIHSGTARIAMQVVGAAGAL